MIFRTLSEGEAVTTCSSDGLYLRESKESAQVISIGPMPYTPMEIQTALNLQTGQIYDLAEFSLMPSPKKSTQRTVWFRMFVSMIFERG